MRFLGIVVLASLLATSGVNGAHVVIDQLTTTSNGGVVRHHAEFDSQTDFAAASSSLSAHQPRSFSSVFGRHRVMSSFLQHMLQRFHGQSLEEQQEEREQQTEAQFNVEDGDEELPMPGPDGRAPPPPPPPNHPPPTPDFFPTPEPWLYTTTTSPDAAIDPAHPLKVCRADAFRLCLHHPDAAAAPAGDAAAATMHRPSHHGRHGGFWRSFFMQGVADCLVERVDELSTECQAQVRLLPQVTCEPDAARLCSAQLADLQQARAAWRAPFADGLVPTPGLDVGDEDMGFGSDGHDNMPHGVVPTPIGGDGHDNQPHGTNAAGPIGGDGHDMGSHGGAGAATAAGAGWARVSSLVRARRNLQQCVFEHREHVSAACIDSVRRMRETRPGYIACHADAERLCSASTPAPTNNGVVDPVDQRSPVASNPFIRINQVVDCLSSQRDSLSATCRAFVGNHPRVACKADVDHLCPNAQTRAEVITCMRSHAAEVSQTCKDAVAEMRRQNGGGIGCSGDGESNNGDGSGERPIDPRVKQACNVDAHLYCSQFLGAPDYVRWCMKSHWQQLSPICRATIEYVSKTKPIDPRIKLACATDAHTYCASHIGKPWEMRRCMMQHYDQLSAVCRLTIQHVGDEQPIAPQVKQACNADAHLYCASSLDHPFLVRRCMTAHWLQLGYFCRQAIKTVNGGHPPADDNGNELPDPDGNGNNAAPSSSDYHHHHHRLSGFVIALLIAGFIIALAGTACAVRMYKRRQREAAAARQAADLMSVNAAPQHFMAPPVAAAPVEAADHNAQGYVTPSSALNGYARLPAQA